LTFVSDELSCNDSASVDVEYETLNVACTIENAPDDLAEFYLDTANIDVVLQKEVGRLVVGNKLGEGDSCPKIHINTFCIKNLKILNNKI